MHSSKAIAPETAMIAKPAAKSTQAKWQKELFKQINAPGPQLFLGALLMLSLFMADSWVLGNAPDSTNDALFGVLTAVFAIFIVEGVILSMVQEGYLFSFFFWMDTVGTLSIILDIGWISDLFIPSGAVSGRGSVLRATRAAKLGARYGRLLRLLRLMRFTRYLPCFSNGEADPFEPTMSAIKRVSEQLSTVLSLRTAALVMILVIVVPFLSYTVVDYSPNAWVDNMKEFAKDPNTTKDYLDGIADQVRGFYRAKNDGVTFVKIESPWVRNAIKHTYKTRDVLRASNEVEFRSSYFVDNDVLEDSGSAAALNWLDKAKAEGRDSEKGKTEFKVLLYIDRTFRNQQNSMFGIILILMVIFLLFAFTASFSSQVNRLVVQPLEKMMSTLRNSAMIMLTSLKAVDTEKDEDANGESKKKDKSRDDGDEEDEEEDEELETAMLEKMVEKLARIVQHVLPGNDEIAMGENIDSNTSNWLSSQYSSGMQSNKGANAKRGLSGNHPYQALSVDEEAARMKAIDDSQKIISREQLNSWEFNVLDYSNEELCEIVTYIFNTLDLLDLFKVDRSAFRSFLGKISGRYINTNTYHNFKHGCDVCHTSYRLMIIPQLHTVFSELEVFSVLVGALAHDVGHPGINNAFLVKTKHELALSHNDRSPLENMHCVVLYDILSKKGMNIFSGLSETEWRESRKVILTIILGTDMSHHFEQISKTQLFFEVNGEDTAAFCKGEKDEIACLADEKNRLFIMELVLHCSDISNPFKPFKLCAKWADLVVEEFCQQGDRERELGMEISPMCDRTAINLCNMQMGFIEFVVAPLIIAFVNIFPSLHEIGSSMVDNFDQWGNRRINEIKRPPTIVEETTNTDETATQGENGVQMTSKKAEKAVAPVVVDQAANTEEVKKMEERKQKFKDRLAFVKDLQGMPGRKRSSFVTNHSA